MSDLVNLVVQNETQFASSYENLGSNHPKSSGVGAGAGDKGGEGGRDVGVNSNFANLVAYVASTDDSSPDYVSPGHVVDSDFIVQFM